MSDVKFKAFEVYEESLSREIVCCCLDDHKYGFFGGWDAALEWSEEERLRRRG